MSHDIDVSIGNDPTKAILSESDLHKKYLCDYVINTAVGCRHGCKFCYVPSSPNIRARAKMLKEQADVDNPQLEWGEYVLRQTEETADKLASKLENKRKWKHTDKGRGIVALSFSTDCYQDGQTASVTRACVETLLNHSQPNGRDIYVRILTRNPILALQDIDVYKNAGENVIIGSSIPSLNNEEVMSIEPRAPLATSRLQGLQEFADAGVPTFVSMSPTYPTQTKSDLRTQMEKFTSLNPRVIFHEPINPRGGNFSMTIDAARDAGEEELATKLETIQTKDEWVSYAVQHLKWVQELGEELNLPVHLWPDKSLLKHTEGDEHDWIQQWLDRQSCESFAGRNVPTTDPPVIPSTTRNKSTTLDAFK